MASGFPLVSTPRCTRGESGNKVPRPYLDGTTGLTLISSPWRHEYFDKPKQKGCFICRAIKDKPAKDRQNLLLVRGDHAVLLLNRYPYTAGALMIAPAEHLAKFGDITDETMLAMMHLIKRGMGILECALDPKGYNIGVNQGKEAGAGLDNHLHIHLVPRWGADTNFMTSIAGARVLAEDLDSMFRRLSRAIRRMEHPRPRKARRKRA
jgi:ATP adenylyltransferase